MRKSLTIAGEPQIPLYDPANMDRDLRTVAKGQLAEKITGGLSQTERLPFPSWGLSATRCKTGSVLAAQENTVCATCYASKGRYNFPNVQAKLERRYEGLRSPLWTPSMVFMIEYVAPRYFRWFDSGDLASESQLRNIITICQHTRNTLHWLPTREREVVHACADLVPDNLTIRLSGNQIDGPPPSDWPTTSTVYTEEPHPDSFVCPAKITRQTCGLCRSCFSKTVKDIAYKLH